MNDRGIAGLIDYFRKQAASVAEVATDGELVRQYVEGKNETAFESLVRRHGPMVNAVARRVLRDGHAAEDVFQATFLALSRKARSLRNHQAIGGWLYRVALRAALRAKPQAAVLRPRRDSTDPAADAQWSELRTVLDEEIDKLPDRCRLAVIACYLNGRSTDDAAKEFGCPRGTVLSRLAAAREKLRHGLSRRGYSLSIAGLTAGLTGEATSVALPSSLIALTTKVALPSAVLTPTVIYLAQGVLHAMWITKVKVAVIAVVTVGLLGIGAGKVFGPAPAIALVLQQPANKNLPSPEEPKIDEAFPFANLQRDVAFQKPDTPERKLMAERLDAALREANLRLQEYQVGRGTLDILLESSNRICAASLELAATHEDRVKILVRFVATQKIVFELNKTRFEVGAIKEQDYQETLYMYIDAQLRLLREKEGKIATTR